MHKTALALKQSFAEELREEESTRDPFSSTGYRTNPADVTVFHKPELLLLQTPKVKNNENFKLLFKTGEKQFT